ncbi:hypothetical protein [Spartinivicinus marinus]|uniref:hypothetical protein n=1 Tax=Spartinivicinus marinus TaxID=2994442 RepID=UPI00224F997B|nr:hypothetical protein [Spartinivicinus marinus]MCX4027938.1 hypothetical protein [Spartinivicinus marinus]
MGIACWVDACRFNIPKEKHSEIYDLLIKKLKKESYEFKGYSFPRTLRDLLDRIGIDISDDGELYGFVNEVKFGSRSDTIFEVLNDIAPYVEEDSYIQVENELSIEYEEDHTQTHYDVHTVKNGKLVESGKILIELDRRNWFEITEFPEIDPEDEELDYGVGKFIRKQIYNYYLGKTDKSIVLYKNN